jgi:hypothetical protein
LILEDDIAGANINKKPVQGDEERALQSMPTATLNL